MITWILRTFRTTQTWSWTEIENPSFFGLGISSIFFCGTSVDPPGALYKAALCGAEEIYRGGLGVFGEFGDVSSGGTGHDMGLEMS